jgi:hypothetical protein
VCCGSKIHSTIVNGARLIGPSVAGVLIATLGEGMCFLLNGLSLIAVIVALLAMKITPKKREIQKPGVLRGLKERKDFLMPLVLRP